jgi:TetR/AcrR family transcriptional regulator, cholesterol catabolism regulator
MSVGSSDGTLGDSREPYGRILGIVVEIIEADGYEAVQLREVARRARTSLATIYKRYANRDELILAALQTWMDENRYSQVSRPARGPDESVYEGLVRLFRNIFEPWEQHPAMLAAFYRARSSPSGEQLLHHGLDMVVPAGMEVLAGVDERFIADLDTVISSLVYGLLGRFAVGEIAITDIVPSLERCVFWMTRGHDAVNEQGVEPARATKATPKKRARS